jgi:hypothetical protein
MDEKRQCNICRKNQSNTMIQYEYDGNIHVAEICIRCRTALKRDVIMTEKHAAMANAIYMADAQLENIAKLYRRAESETHDDIKRTIPEVR